MFQQNMPIHSCKQILESRSTVVDGEYWIDPGNIGSPLKVYCDMTTDGGKILCLLVLRCLGETHHVQSVTPKLPNSRIQNSTRAAPGVLRFGTENKI